MRASFFFLSVLVGCGGGGSADLGTHDFAMPDQAVTVLDDLSSSDAATSPDFDDLSQSPDMTIVGNSYWVNPVSGLDTNPGTQALPLFTIQKATSLTKAHDRIVLMDGTYSYSTQNKEGGATIPDAVDVIAQNEHGPIIEYFDLMFTGSSNVSGLQIGGDPAGSQLRVTAGTVTLTDPWFLVNGDIYPIAVANTGKVVIQSLGTFAYYGGATKSKRIAIASDTGSLSVINGVFDGAPETYQQEAMFSMTNSSTLSLSNVTVKNAPMEVISLIDSSHATLDGVTIDTCGTSSGNGTIQLWNATDTGDIGLTLSNTTITGGVDAIWIGWQNHAVKATIAITGSHIVNQTDRAIYDEYDNGTVSLTFLDSFVNNNLKGGVSFHTTYTTPKVPVTFVAHGTDFSGNGSASNIELWLADGSSINLGDSTTAGGNKFGSSTTALILNVPITLTTSAVGNTWTANTEGADANGHYATATVTGPTSGTNYELVNASPLQF
jgi:hypothetical protein